jgi:hypothetical protein
MTKAGDIEVIVAHDRKGIDLLTDNDMVEMSLDEALVFSSALSEKIKEAKRGTPPAPAPLKIEGHNWKDNQSFAQCGRLDKGMQAKDWAGGMGRYEINYLNLIEIRDWCNKSLEYIKNEVVKHEST